MKMKRLSAFIMAAFMLIQCAAFAAPAATPEPTPYPYSNEYGWFEDIAQAISELYIDESYTKEKVMVDGTARLISNLLSDNEPLLIEVLKATLENLDDYSEFYTAEEYEQFDNQLNNTFYGIGILMKMGDDGYVEVTEFAENSDNAQKAGFQIGDKIIKVDGRDVSGQSVTKVREQVVGDKGTTVNITVLRNGQEIELTATRVAVNAATVSSGILDGNIGYIQLRSFGTDTPNEFTKALDNMRQNKVKKIILDLRNNGGGIVPSAISIAQAIVPKGKIVDVKFRQSQYNYTSTLSKKEFDFLVLVNENTASASEILASAIQDSKAGQLVGVQTFGKAVIQNTYPLTNGAVFKLTTGQYITRNGREINKIGLTPDIYVENVVSKLDTSAYTQFDYASRTALGAKSDNAKAAKERLGLLGFYSGEENDIYDTDLRDAVKTFQQVNNVFSYGVLDIPTQKLIEEKVTSLDVTDDRQLKTAYEKFGGDVTKLYN